jgi:glycosyltransferase involved in cell wall biosynthesis
MAYASEVELSGMGSVRSMRKQESHEFIRGSVKVLGIPAYNEEASIAKVIVQSRKFVDKIVVCDDGSEDLTRKIAESLGAEVIAHSSNLGYGAALRDLLDWARRAGADVLVTLDADGQHDPNEIPSLISPILAGEADVTVGHRPFRPAGMTRRRRIAQKMLDVLTGVKENGTYVDSQSGFRAYSRRALSLEVSESGMGAESEVLLRAKRTGLMIRQVPVHVRYEAGSRAGAAVQFSDVISAIVKTWLTRRPARILGIPGVVLLLVGMLGWLEVFANYDPTKGFAIGHALVYTIILLSGILMTMAAMLLFIAKMMMQGPR